MSAAKWFLAMVAVGVVVALAGCGGGSSDPEVAATDYSNPAHWLTIPAALDKPVDVFYLYPTAWQSSDPDPQVCAIDEPTMLVGAPQAFARQATAFATVGNIYAPYYRQDNLSAVRRESVIAGIPTTDAMAAFDYYIKHYNNNRPFILAGHSQGSNVLSNLLARYMKRNPNVQRRMIVAYVIGYSVTAAYLAENPHLKFAEGPDDTGVIVSYNTEAPDVAPGANPVLSGVGLVINPLTWTRDETEATTAEGLGSFLPGPGGGLTQVPQYADARIDKAKGVLICTTANEDEMYAISGGLGRGVYHSFDYPFYYFNIRQNAANRVSKFTSGGDGWR